MGYSPVAIAERRDQRLWHEAEARSEQALETYDRLTMGASAIDACDREDAIGDHVHDLTPALHRLHIAVSHKHSMMKLAEAVRDVVNEVDSAFEQFAESTADYYLEKNDDI